MGKDWDHTTDKVMRPSRPLSPQAGASDPGVAADITRVMSDVIRSPVSGPSSILGPVAAVPAERGNGWVDQSALRNFATEATGLKARTPKD